ncbi:MAG: oligosaccharide flippase family protein [Clostridiales bacterium]|nr:oligosaccharide flippase family protein [Clostridiales bacterium]
MSEKDEKRNFGGAWVLSAAALASKGIGALYRIPLTRILGARGMGLYQSVYPLYALLVTFATGGLGAAAAVITAKEEHFPAFRAVLCSLAVTLPLAVLGAALSRVVSAGAGAREAWFSLFLLCAFVPLSGVTALFRGYFQGRGVATHAAAAQLIEQVVKLLCGLLLSAFFGRFSPALAVAGAALGVGLSEGASVLFSVLCYVGRKKPVRHRRKERVAFSVAAKADALASEASAELFPSVLSGVQDEPSQEKRIPQYKSLFKKLYAVAVPVAAGLAVLPLCGALDSFTVVNLLVRGGGDRASATALYGLVSGPVSALIALPAVFTLGLSSMLLPRVSMLKKNDQPILPHVKRAFAFALFIGIVTGGGLFAFSPLVLRLLYGADVPAGGTLILRVCALSVPFVSVLQIATAVLQGVGKASAPFFALLFAAAVKELLNLLLLPHVGAVGFALSTVSFYLLACGIDLLVLSFLLRPRKETRADFSPKTGESTKDMP